MVLDGGWSLPVLPMAWLYALKDLAKLVPNLSELTVDFLTESLMFLF